MREYFEIGAILIAGVFVVWCLFRLFVKIENS